MTKGKTEDGDAATMPHDLIASIAYSYWEQGGRRDGSAEADWLRACETVRSRQSVNADADRPQENARPLVCDASVSAAGKEG